MSTMNRIRLSSILAAALLACGGTARAAVLNVVTTTEDLASIAREVGGDKVKVESLSRGYQDPHFVEAKPSFVIKLHSADLLIAVGRELEIGWLPPLVTQARNAKVQPGGAGYLDASAHAKILEIPTGQITRAMGDVHPAGNPHYWLDPDNGVLIAKDVAAKLGALDAANAAYYQQQAQAFAQKVAAAAKRWDAMMAPYKGTQLVTYHRSWPNLLDRFGLQVVGYVEPRPGIPPSPSHTLDLIKEMKAKNVKLILVEPYFDLKTPNAIARETGAKVLVLAPSVGGVKEAADYVALFDYDLKQIVDALQAAR
jgi:zinc/manganese transport system substrate-binding protein